MDAEAGPASGTRRRKTLIRLVTMVTWGMVFAFQAGLTVRNPGPVNIISTGAFGLLFVVVYAQLFLVGWLGQRRWSRLTARLHGSAYLSDLENLPNRNYLLSELRREMPRARRAGTPFVLIVLSLDNLDGIRARRGEEFADRAINGLASVLKRFTRTSDFVAHLDGHRFCVMLNECTYEDSFIYLRRVPGTIAVSDGHRMYEVPVSARVSQYDMEGLYATDVLREAEEAQPLRRQQEPRYGSEAA
ncbi:MAG: GGDEF domain-containing protein [Dehalococcoidia bacterium]|nr:GGDEF domain-containing protein [Dehalococcoidia bacterium]